MRNRKITTLQVIKRVVYVQEEHPAGVKDSTEENCQYREDKQTG